MFGTNLILIIGVLILGTYLVSTLDDLLKMSASVSFVYIWGLIALVLFGYLFYKGDPSVYYRVGFGVVLYILLHFNLLGFKLANGDIIAMMPIVFLFSLFHVILFVVFVLLIDKFLLRIVYSKILRKKTYPFMPAIFVGLVLMLLLIYTGGYDMNIEQYITKEKVEQVQPEIENESVDIVVPNNTEVKGGIT